MMVFVTLMPQVIHVYVHLDIVGYTVVVRNVLLANIGHITCMTYITILYILFLFVDSGHIAQYVS